MTRRRARRRKTRSPWGRWIGGGLAVVIVLGVVGVLGAYFWIRNYLRSPEFLAVLNEKTSGVLQAEATFQPFIWEGLQVRSPKLDVQGEGMIRLLEAEDFETEVSLGSLLRRKFESSEFNGRSVFVDLDLTKPAPVLPKTKRGADVEFPGVKVSSVSGTMAAGKNPWSWSAVSADVRGGSAKGSYDIQLGGGSVTTPISIFPKGKLRSVTARYFAGTLFVTEGDFEIYDSGNLELVGEVGFNGGNYALEGSMRRVLCEEIVPEDWKKRLLGTMESDFTVTGSSRRPPIIRGDLWLKQGVLTALPVLDRMAAYTDTSRFRRLDLNEATLSYTQNGNRLELRDVVIESDGLVRLEGRLDIVDNRLDGTFQFGVMPGVMAGIPGAETKVFLPGKEGLLWTPVRVTGTLDDPKEDLSKRMIAAAGERMFELLPETGLMVLKHSGRAASDMAQGVLEKVGDLGQTGGSVLDTGAGVLRDGSDAVRDGVGGLFNLIPGGRREDTTPPPGELPPGDLPEEDELEEEAE